MGVDAKMLVKIQHKENWLTQKEVTRLAFELGDRFGADAFFRYDGRHNVSILDGDYLQDGDEISPGPDEQFLEVHLGGRYYGPGYERGDIVPILAIAEFLEYRTSGSVFYGGDSSGIYAQPFDAEARRAMKKHFYEHGHSPYYSGFGMFSKDWRPGCVCDLCQEPMIDHGGGGNYFFMSCHGCDTRKITTTSGKEITLNRGEDFFAGSNRLKDEGFLSVQ